MCIRDWCFTRDCVTFGGVLYDLSFIFICVYTIYVFLYVYVYVYMYFWYCFEIHLSSVAGYVSLFARYCCRPFSLTVVLHPIAAMGRITGRLGLAFCAFPLSSSTFLLLLSSGLGAYGSVLLRGHVQLPSL